MFIGGEADNCYLVASLGLDGLGLPKFRDTQSHTENADFLMLVKYDRFLGFTPRDSVSEYGTEAKNRCLAQSPFQNASV